MAEIKMPNNKKEKAEEVEELEEVEADVDQLPTDPPSVELDIDLESEEAFVALADVPPDTETWEGGPTTGQMLEWIEKHGHVYVTSISFDEHIAWRPLKRSEYARISSMIESEAMEKGELELQMLNEELVCRICVIFPDYSQIDFDDLLAGVPTLVSQQILERSGFTHIGLREMI